MPSRHLAGLGVLLSFAAPAAAQQTADQSQLVFTIGAGFVGGQSLWEIPRQGIRGSGAAVSDTFDLARKLRSSLGFIFSGSYFPGDHVGFEAEALLVGLGSEDSCRPIFIADPTFRNGAVCDRLNGRSRSATSVALNGGIIYRVLGHSAASPFVRLNVGLDLTEQSTLRTTGDFIAMAGPDSGLVVDVPIYLDPRGTRVTPYASLTVGFTAAVARGYQLRLEARDNYVGVPVVTGATIFDNNVPPNAVKGKHVFSLMIGFDVVLERRRGRRY